MMEYMELGDLSAFLKRNNHSIPLSLALKLASDVALALRDLHNSGIIHRDLKPGNVVIGNAKGTLCAKVTGMYRFSFLFFFFFPQVFLSLNFLFLFFYFPFSFLFLSCLFLSYLFLYFSFRFLTLSFLS